MKLLLHVWIIALMVFFKPVEGQFLSPERIEVDLETGTCYISLSTAQKVALYDLRQEKLLKEISLPFDPAGLALDNIRQVLCVSGGNEKGRVLLLDKDTHETIGDVDVGHSPGDLCLAANKGLLFVTNRFTHEISVISLEEQKEVSRIQVEREPMAIAISPDERLVAVAHYLSGKVSLIDAVDLELTGQISLPTGSGALRDLSFSKDGSSLYVTHNLSRYYVPATQVNRGWLNNSALSVLDAVNKIYTTTVLLDDIDKGAAGPCGIAVSDDDSNIYISISGTHELCVIDRVGMHEKIKSASQESKEEIPYSLTFLNECKTRVPLTGNSPRYIATYENRIVIPTYYSAGMNIIQTETLQGAAFVSLGEEPGPTRERLGEQHFHDASLSYQGWQSCATCHMGNGRVDGLNWDLPGDGFGNPKNTKSLLTSHQTPPVNHTGNVPDLSSAVRSGIKGSIFVDLPERYAVELESYLAGLQPVASPFLVNGSLSEAAMRGEAAFVKAGCAECHSGTYNTNLNMYDVGTGTAGTGGTAFDTPTLLEMWRTAPYLHDGRANTLDELFNLYNTGDRHGKTNQLSPGELKDLIEYVNSL